MVIIVIILNNIEPGLETVQIEDLFHVAPYQ